MLRRFLTNGAASVGLSRCLATPSTVVTRLSSLRATLGQQHQQLAQKQLRWNWQAVIRRRFDRTTGKWKYQDWDVIDRSFREPELLDGTTLLNRHLAQKEHVKPTELKRRLNAAKAYRRSVKRVDDLTKYIKFIQEKGGAERLK